MGHHTSVTLFGEDNTGRPLSLSSGFLKAFTIPAPETSPATFHFDLAFLGSHFPGKDRPFLTELKARLPALDNWLGISGLEIERMQPRHQVAIRFSQPDDLEFELEPDLKLIFEFAWYGPILRRTQIEASVRQEAWLTLRSASAKTYHDLSTIFSRMINLFSLLTGEVLVFEYQLANSHEPNLPERLKDMLRPFGDLFGNLQETYRLAESTATTRNYLTHYDPKMKDRAVEPSRLTPYIYRLNVLFGLRCLLELGWTPGEARQCIEKHERLRQEVRFGRI